MPTDPRAFLPLKPVDFELLLALSGEDRHGYGLVQAVAAHSGGLITLDPGNLYRVIKRLLADGLVGDSERRDDDGDPAERRRYYRLTALGGRVLAAEIDRLQALVRDSMTRQAARRLT